MHADAKRLLWLYQPMLAPVVQAPDSEAALLVCPLASARLRMAVAANAWRNAGGVNHYSGAEAIPDADICIVQKFTGDMPVDPWLSAAHSAKSHGQKLIIDVCDYPFRSTKGAVPAFYGQALPLADAVVVNSQRMAEQMAPHCDLPVTVIEDAVLGEMRAIRFDPKPPLQVLWFGHPSNLRFLEPWIHALIQQGPKPLKLTVVTHEGYGIREGAANINAQLAPAFEMAFVEWSLEATQQALANCDLAILPSDPNDPRKSGASANRLAEVLQAGRFVVASPLQSYLPFADTAWVGANLLEGIAWALQHPDAVRARIAKGQALVRERYAMQAIGEQWCALLNRLLN